MPSTRVYFYDIAQRSQMPIIQVSYNALRVPLDLSEYQEGVPANIKNEDFAVCFVYELMNETGKLEQKCTLGSMQIGIQRRLKIR